jgi:hypothetical protein
MSIIIWSDFLIFRPKVQEILYLSKRRGKFLIPRRKSLESLLLSDRDFKLIRPFHRDFKVPIPPVMGFQLS